MYCCYMSCSVFAYVTFRVRLGMRLPRAFKLLFFMFLDRSDILISKIIFKK
jgi:hypothetical protein